MGLSLSTRRAPISPHDVLGPRLILCTMTVLEIRRHSVLEIFGSPDDLKFRSSMTLFEEAALKEMSSVRSCTVCVQESKTSRRSIPSGPEPSAIRKTQAGSRQRTTGFPVSDGRKRTLASIWHVGASGPFGRLHGAYRMYASSRKRSLGCGSW